MWELIIKSERSCLTVSSISDCTDPSLGVLWFCSLNTTFLLILISLLRGSKKRYAFCVVQYPTIKHEMVLESSFLLSAFGTGMYAADPKMRRLETSGFEPNQFWFLNSQILSAATYVLHMAVELKCYYVELNLNWFYEPQVHYDDVIEFLSADWICLSVTIDRISKLSSIINSTSGCKETRQDDAWPCYLSKKK